MASIIYLMMMTKKITGKPSQQEKLRFLGWFQKVMLAKKSLTGFLSVSIQ
jgi:hypothetical protein